jgi:DNA-binding transcriptional MerR regulator
VAYRRAPHGEGVRGEHRVVLEFTVGQVCTIAGITEVQLDQWTLRGSIPTHGTTRERHYSLDAVETVLLIKQGRDLGFGLTAAIEAARDVQARRLPEST